MGGGEDHTDKTDTESEAFLVRLRARDEHAFRHLVRSLHSTMLSLARTFVKSRATAEEVVQDTWLAVITGLPGFEGRSTLKSWIIGILVNKARTRGARDGRIVSFSDLGVEGDPAVDPDRFKSNGMWADPPGAWLDITPERIVAGRQMLEHVWAALETLPPAQRSVIILREVEGLGPEEACLILGVSEANQRVLLHRGRSRIRHALETLLDVPAVGHLARPVRKV